MGLGRGRSGDRSCCLHSQWETWLGWGGFNTDKVTSMVWRQKHSNISNKNTTQLFTHKHTKIEAPLRHWQRDAQCDFESALWKTWNEANSENSGIGISWLELIQTLWKATKPLRSFGSSMAGISTRNFKFFPFYFYFLRNKQTLPGEKKKRRRKEEFAGGGLSSVAAGTGPGLRVWLLVMRFQIHPGNG